MKKARRPWWNNKYSVSQLFLQARHPHRTKATYGAGLRNYTFSIAWSKIQLHYTRKRNNQNTERWHSFFSFSSLWKYIRWSALHVTSDWGAERGLMEHNRVNVPGGEVCSCFSSGLELNSFQFHQFRIECIYKCKIKRTRSISKRTSRTELALVMSRSEMERTPAQVPVLRVNWCEGEHCYSSWSLNHDLVS